MYWISSLRSYFDLNNKRPLCFWRLRRKLSLSSSITYRKCKLSPISDSSIQSGYLISLFYRWENNTRLVQWISKDHDLKNLSSTWHRDACTFFVQIRQSVTGLAEQLKEFHFLGLLSASSHSLDQRSTWQSEIWSYCNRRLLQNREALQLKRLTCKWEIKITSLTVKNLQRTYSFQHMNA